MKALSRTARRAIPGFLQAGDYAQTDEGLLVHSSIRIRGKYTDWVNGDDRRVNYNLLVDQGILYILEAALGNNTALATLYLAPYGTNIAPANDWTAASFTGTAGEITSTSEGWAGTNREEWDAGAAASGAISNSASRASHTIVSTGPVNIYGAGLISSQLRGAATGTLVSAVQFGAVRTVNNTDNWELAYEVELTDS